MRIWLIATVVLFAISGLMTPAAPAAEPAKPVATAKPPEVPAWLEAKIGGLTKEQREFLLSEDADGFAGSHKKLLQRLETKTPEEIAAYVDGMMSVAKAQKFNRGDGHGGHPAEHRGVGVQSLEAAPARELQSRGASPDQFR